MQQNHPVSGAETSDTTAMPRTVWRRPQLLADDVSSSTMFNPAGFNDDTLYGIS
ncbi:hypothetical protein [Tistrella sp.]|uniref:hypothetical protein n=1 Tax=Tistrella sp. TaxID=2024861 RepID=UPI0025F96DA8|nr:hypothetical protein [Tistrella sp.]|tara:strand:- start:253 stop:414 length:162 start_codon:yes stop_codon:yes gene_type:complete